jgi:hypothetical protein
MKSLAQGLLALVIIAVIGVAAVGRLNGDAPVAQLAPVATVTAPAVSRIVAAQDQDVNSAIQQVIQRSNDEQVTAIANRDPSLMSDTLTSDHYQQLVQINQDLLDHGVSSISLLRLDWGAINVSGSSATAITYETWRTTFADGSTEQSRDQNNYALVLDNGAWKIQADDHPTSAAAPPSQRPVPSVPGIPDNQNTSHNWSGYAATGGSYTAVSGTWTVPAFSPDGTFGIDAAWVGIGGVHSRDLIQAGTEQTVSGAGRTQYEAWIETLPQASRTVALSVHPGDSVSVSIAEQTTNNWLIQFQNNTTGQSYQETVAYTSSHSSAEWVEEAPSAGRGGVLPLSNFGSIDFTNGTAVKDGQTVTIASAGARPVTMINANAQALAVPGKLNDDGASFSVARTNTPATTTAGPRNGRGRRGG